MDTISLAFIGKQFYLTCFAIFTSLRIISFTDRAKDFVGSAVYIIEKHPDTLYTKKHDLIYLKDSNTRDLHPVDEETEDGSFLTGFKTFFVKK